MDTVTTRQGVAHETAANHYRYEHPRLADILNDMYIPNSDPGPGEKVTEIRAALGAEHARVVEAYYGVTVKGNFEGRNILNVPRPFAQVSRELGVPREKVRTVVEASRDMLYAERAKRPPPLRDEKVLAAWNGLMIGAEARAALVLGVFAASAAQAPAALAEMLLATDFRLDTAKEVVIVAPTSRRDAEPLLARLRSTFLPNRVLVVAVEGEDLDAQSQLIPLLKGKVSRNGKAMAYVCERSVCKLPTSDPEVLARLLRSSPSP